MTCKDCIHYIAYSKSEWYSFTDIGTCDKAGTERIMVNEDCPVNRWCDNKFEMNDGSYYKGSWHCPRCGKEVSVWGLCNDCEDSLESENK